jgi:hypothetical protein
MTPNELARYTAAVEAAEAAGRETGKTETELAVCRARVRERAHLSIVTGLMDVTTLEGGARKVRCPGCCAEETYPPPEFIPANVVDGAHGLPPFRHADLGCPVLRTINAAYDEFAFGDAEVRS